MATATAPMTPATPAPAVPRTAIALRISDDAIANVEAIASVCKLQAIENEGTFRRAFLMAQGIRALREAISKDMMTDLMSLQGSSLGFRTDMDSKGGYTEDVVKECAIECVLRGGRWVGNEFNIIAKRCYMTKEFFTRAVREFPGLTDLRLMPGVPQNGTRGALVPFSATWRRNGIQESLDRTLTKLPDGTELDERICVRVNEGQIIDAIMGKAERKMLAAIHKRLTGSDFTDGDAADVIDVKPLPRNLDQLTERLTGPVAGNGDTAKTAETTATSTNTPASAPALDMASVRKSFDDATSIGAVEEQLTALVQGGLSDLAFADVNDLAETAKERIRNSRGSKSNKPQGSAA